MGAKVIVGTPCYSTMVLRPLLEHTVATMETESIVGITAGTESLLADNNDLGSHYHSSDLSSKSDLRPQFVSWLSTKQPAHVTARVVP
jgi:hypothetical protein